MYFALVEEINNNEPIIHEKVLCGIQILIVNLQHMAQQYFDLSIIRGVWTIVMTMAHHVISLWLFFPQCIEYLLLLSLWRYVVHVFVYPKVNLDHQTVHKLWHNTSVESFKNFMIWFNMKSIQ